MGASCCHEHRRYTRGCPLCRERAREYRRVRMHSIGAGTWDRGWVSGPPLERMRAHVLQLLAHPDVSLRMIAAAAGVGHTSTELLSRGQMERATGTVVEALAGVTLAAVLRQITNPNQLVSAVGSARRLQALAVDDWGTEEIAGLVGVHATLVRRHRSGPPYRRISWGYRERYRELYDKIQSQANPRGPSPVAGRRAADRGWVGPERWADEDLDDPNAQPPPPPPDDDDWVAVTQQIEDALQDPRADKAANYTRAVKREIARHAVNRLGWPWERVAWLLGYKSASTAEYLVRGRPDRAPVRRERER